MEISHEDESMEDDSGQEEIQDDIEDDKMDAGTGVYFSIEDQDIDRFLLLRRQLKKSKSHWLVQNPEKLLLPDTDTSDHVQAPLDKDKETGLPSCVTSGKMFKEALSRPGMDIIEHYNLLQEDPSAIAGALQFNLPTTERESNDMVSTPSSDINVGECDRHMETSAAEYAHADATMGEYEPLVGAETAKVSSLQETNNTILERGSPSICLADPTMREEACWDKFSWSTKLMQRNPLSAEGNTRRDTCTNKSMLRSPTLEAFHSRESNIWEDTPMKQGNKGIMENSNSASDRFNPLYDRRDDCDHESTGWDPCRSSPQIIEKVAIGSSMQATSPLSDSLPSSRVVNPAEGTSRDDIASNMEAQVTEDKAMGRRTEDSTHSCLSSEPVPFQHSFPDGVDERRDDGGGQVEWGTSRKKRFLLDDLITGAVMAECQLHKQTFSHFDLEPLTRLLSRHIAAFFEAQKTKALVFKDLVDSCIQRAEGDKPSGSITLQRYFIALLSSIHQQNMAKDKRMQGLQILLKEGATEKLPDITINLLPSGLV